MSHFPAERVLRLARWIFDSDSLERVIDPTLADLEHEWEKAVSQGDLRAARRVRWQGTWTLVRVLALLVVKRRLDAAGHVRWWLASPMIAAAMVGVISMDLVSSPSKLVSQSIFVALGLIVLAWFATTPGNARPRTGRFDSKDGPLESLSFAPLVLAPLLWLLVSGKSIEGATRWLGLGPLNVRVAEALAPVFLMALVGLRARPRGQVLFATACLFALALAPEPAFVLVWGAVALAVAPGWPRRVIVSLAIVASGAAALLHPVHLTPVPHVEGVVVLLASRFPWLLAVGVFSLASVAMLALSIARRTVLSAPPGPAASVAHPLARGALALAVAYPAAKYLLDDSLPMLGFGGSAVFAMACLVGLLLRLDATWVRYSHC